MTTPAIPPVVATVLRLYARALIWLGGIGPFLMVNLPLLLLAETIGVWLF